MRALFNDIRGGCAIIRHAYLQMLLLVAVVAVSGLVLDPRSPVGTWGIQLQPLVVANKNVGVPIILVVVMAVVTVPVFFAVEFARIGAERRSGSESRLRYLPSFRLIWSSLGSEPNSA